MSTLSMKKIKNLCPQLCKTLLSVKNEKIMIALLDDLLTPKEQKVIEERISILKALTKNIDQRTIAKALKVSIGKITRGSRVIQSGNINWKKS